MDKTLARSIQLQRTIVDIENAEAKIKEIEKDICYAQQKIQEEDKRIEKLKSISENLKKILFPQKEEKKIKQKPKKKVKGGK